MTLFLPLVVSLLSLLFGHDEAELLFAGDAMMHQAQLDRARRTDGTYDFSDCFARIQPYVTSADYAVVNLETPVSARHRFSGYPCFNAPASYIDALADAGFDMFLTANNHTLDRRDSGLRATLDALDSRRLDHIGTYRHHAERDSLLPFIRNLNGISVGFLNYTYGTNGITPGPDVVVDYIDREVMRADVKKLRRSGAEIIVACVHWGVEYKLLPHPSQESLAGYLTDSLGVEIVIGGHPHVVQPMHRYTDRNRLVVYSLGNFISNMKTRDTRGGALARILLRRADDGTVRIARAAWRLVYTIPPATPSDNFTLTWPDDTSDTRAKAFAEAARDLFRRHNTAFAESIPR